MAYVLLIVFHMMKYNLAIASILSLATGCALDSNESHESNLEHEGTALCADITCAEGQHCEEVAYPCGPDELCVQIVQAECIFDEGLPEPTPNTPTPDDPEAPTSDYCPGCGLG